MTDKTPENFRKRRIGGGADGKLHDGELFIQDMAGARPTLEEDIRQVIRSAMPDQHRQFFTNQLFLFVGSIDEFQMPSASLVFGSPGLLARSPTSKELIIQTNILPSDPLKKNLALGSHIGLLGLEFWTRRRNRMNGKVTGMFDPTDDYKDSFRLGVDLSFGNCPKYIVRRVPVIDTSGKGSQQLLSSLHPSNLYDPRDSSDQNPTTEFLTAQQQAIVGRADTFFVASAYVPDDTPAAGVDVSHRGGRPGFVQVSGDGKTIRWPDYIGNFFFNTLGNLHENPKCGLLILDFESGDTLQINGTAKILFTGFDQPGALRTVELSVSRVIHHKKVVPFEWEFIDISPYSPDVIVPNERKSSTASHPQQLKEVVECVDIIDETHDVKTFFFRTSPTARAEDSLLMRFIPGQYATFDINMSAKCNSTGEEVCKQSTSSQACEAVRTWTVSECPRWAPAEAGEKGGHGSAIVFAITVKRKLGGLVSPFLHDQIQKGMSLVLTGVGGSFTMESILSRRPETRKSLMVAAGSGITPFMSILRGLAAAQDTDSSSSPSQLKHRLVDLDIVLFFSVKTKQDVVYQSELLSLQKRFPGNFRLICTLTQPTSSNLSVSEEEEQPRFLQGRISKQAIAAEVPDLMSRTAAVCGPQAFTDGVQAALAELGFSSDYFITESFDF